MDVSTGAGALRRPPALLVGSPPFTGPPAAAALIAALPWALASSAGAAELDPAGPAMAVATGGRPQVDRAIERLRYHGNPREVLSRVARMATEGDLTARRNAAYLFSVVADPAYAPALLPALRDADPAVRENSCTALSKMRVRSAAARWCR